MHPCRFHPLMPGMQAIDLIFSFSLLQRCDTWCNIAYVHEKAGHGYEEIEDCYLKALEFAQLSGNQQAVVGVCYQPVKNFCTNN